MSFRKAISALVIGAAGVLPLAGPTTAQEQHVDPLDRRWQGVYVGGQFGYAAASAHIHAPSGVDRTEFGPLIGGVYVGYNILLG